MRRAESEKFWIRYVKKSGNVTVASNPDANNKDADDLYLSRMRSRSPIANDVRRYGSRSSGLPGTVSKRKH